jgi:heterodisulfide reductase subunit A
MRKGREPLGDLRIGVFVCHCGTNIGGVVDVPQVTEYASGLEDVVYAKDNMYTCSDAGLREIKEAITNEQLNRVVVASCTPRTHERLFRTACEEAGLNKFLFEFVNIRDQCSWVHMQDPAKATEKAKDLVRMGVAKSRLLEPMEEIEIDVAPAAMVIGGGMAGMSAAKSFADMGISTYLVEREPQLGGMLNELYALYPSHIQASEFIQPMKDAVLRHPKIEVLTSTQIKDIHGFIGSYEVTVSRSTSELLKSCNDSNDLDVQRLEVGAIVVATGTQVHTPEGEYGYNGQNVVTQLEFEQNILPGLCDRKTQDSRLKTQDNLESVKNVVMIQCVGARSEERRYCSRVCCTEAVKNGVLLKEAAPDVQVFILFRDIQAYTSGFEDYYFGARDKGVIFIRYSEDRPPEVIPGLTGGSVVRVYDQLLGVQLGIPYDVLVLSTPMVPYDDAKELATMLKVPLDENGFFLEAHVKLRPVDFATDGIYLAGCAHWPAHVGEVVSQGQAAASRAAIPLLNGHVRAEPIVSTVDEELCAGCDLCSSLCPFKAIQVEMVESGRKARVITASCKGCGACGAACPQHAITMGHFTDAQIEAQIDALVGS